MIRCIDLFSGCGGLSLGFEKAGYEVVAAFDNWQPAVDVYKENFTHPISNLDLKDEENACIELKKFDFDLIMGGPPCQDFSSAGKRDVNGGRADLTYHYANIICKIKPEWFVMENVEQIKKSHILKEIVQQFSESNYGLTSVILDASYCGVPQARTRFFLIGHYGDKNNQLEEIFKNNLSKKPMTIRDYLGERLNLQYYYRHPRNYNRRGVFSIDEPSPTVRGVNRPVPAGYKINSCDPEGVDLRKIRPLTTIERSYVQTFPDTFKFFGTKTNLEQMIGNAVPVNLGKFVGECILEYIQNGAQKEPCLFDSDELFSIPNRPLQKVFA